MKRGLELVSTPYILYNFWRKIFLFLYSFNWTNFIVCLHFFWEILGNICIAIVCKPGCHFMNFEIKLIFLIKPFFLYGPKSHDKNLNILRTKRAFKMKYKTIFIIFRGLSMKQKTQFFLEGESPNLSKLINFYSSRNHRGYFRGNRS